MPSASDVRVLATIQISQTVDAQPQMYPDCIHLFVLGPIILCTALFHSLCLACRVHAYMSRYCCKTGALDMWQSVTWTQGLRDQQASNLARVATLSHARTFGATGHYNHWSLTHCSVVSPTLPYLLTVCVGGLFASVLKHVTRWCACVVVLSRVDLVVCSFVFEVVLLVVKKKDLLPKSRAPTTAALVGSKRHAHPNDWHRT